jgi:hypothetical protein
VSPVPRECKTLTLLRQEYLRAAAEVNRCKQECRKKTLPELTAFASRVSTFVARYSTIRVKSTITLIASSGLS